MKHTYLTDGLSWDGYVKINGEVVPYADVLSYSDKDVTLMDGSVVSEGVEVIHWLVDVFISPKLQSQLWPDRKPTYDLAKPLDA